MTPPRYWPRWWLRAVVAMVVLPALYWFMAGVSPRYAVVSLALWIGNLQMQRWEDRQP